MNIAIGKSGRSCYFNKKRWDIANGDDSPRIVYYELCRRYPQHKFYMIGGSDLARCKREGEFVPDNMIDLYDEAKTIWKKDTSRELWMYMLDLQKSKGIKFDFGLIMQGPDMSASIKDAGIKKLTDLNTDVTPLCIASNYVAPIYATINEQKFPWIIWNEDPKYVPIMGRDIIAGHDELVVLSQNEEKKMVKRITGYYDDSKIIRMHELNYKYAGLERVWMCGEKKIDYSNPDHIVVGDHVYQKKNKFILTVNQGGDRLKILEKWIFNDNPDQIVYGKWGPATWGSHEKNFVNKLIVDMEEDIWSSMFTFVPPLFKARSNFVTKKVWTMIYHGIIPFFCKDDYDTDHLLPIPDICRVDSPKQMWKRINALYNNREAYKKLLNYFYGLLKDEYFTGDYIDKLIGPFIRKFDKGK